MRTWMSLVAAISLILPLSSARLRAADPELTLKKEDFQKLVDKIDKLQKDMTDNALRGNQTLAELRTIREELQKIRELMERMAVQQGTIRREAGYDPRSVAPGGAPPAAGTIVLQNDFPATATVHINGQSFTVAPYQTRHVGNVPLGIFQYSVDVEGTGAVEPPRSESLRPGGYRIRIFPR